MNTTKKTRTTAITIALAAMLTAGLGACAQADVDTFAERRASDLSHEVQRAENRVDALAAKSQYQDQAERRAGFETPSDTGSQYQDQAERRAGFETPSDTGSSYRDQVERRLRVNR